MKRPSRWSYSAWSTYDGCPAQYNFSYILGLPQPESAPMLRGTRLHKLCEDYLNDPSMPVPYDVKKVGRILDDLRNKQAKPEAVWLVDRRWEPIVQPVGAPTPHGAWVKAIVDVHYLDGRVLQVRDHKSGREYASSHREQLELYSILGLLNYPDAQRAESAAIYLDGGYESCDGSIIREMLPKLIEKWDTRAKTMEADTTFDPKPSIGSCKWCPYASGKGGPCGASRKVGM